LNVPGTHIRPRWWDASHGIVIIKAGVRVEKRCNSRKLNRSTSVEEEDREANATWGLRSGTTEGANLIALVPRHLLLEALIDVTGSPRVGERVSSNRVSTTRIGKWQPMGRFHHRISSSSGSFKLQAGTHATCLSSSSRPFCRFSRGPNRLWEVPSFFTLVIIVWLCLI